MPTEQIGSKREEQFAFYMDLLGHDLLNNNQAVMSYLELLLASPSIDSAARRYAEKAISHVKTSTLLTENTKRLMATRNAEPEAFRPVDICEAVQRAASSVQRFFPGKNIKFSLTPDDIKANVLGNSFAVDLIMNVLVSAIRLDRSETSELVATLAEVTYKEKKCWRLRIEDTNSELPPFLRRDEIEAVYDQDISLAVKTTGLLFAKMIAVNLGGNFEIERLGGRQGKEGAAFIVTLRKVEKV